MSKKDPAQALEKRRHSLAHVLAASVKTMFPEVQLGFGPAIDDGFYYDFLLPEGLSFSSEVVESIEKQMRELLKEELLFEKLDLPLEAAHAMFQNEGLKLELLEDLKGKDLESASVYRTGDFIDLCSGPHVESTKELRSMAWKVDKIAGAYWKGDSDNPMLQRIYILAFSTPKELKAFEKKRKEAMERDHRKLGKELDLYAVSDLVGRGLPMLTPKGATLRRILERWVIDEELKLGYAHVYTPCLGRKTLYEISGHWQHYQDAMYPPINMNDDEYILRPMTCPHHFMLYKDKPRSYRELPIRYAEIAPLFRKELSGDLAGLARIMKFHLADGHIVCREDQAREEFKGAVKLVDYIMTTLGVNSEISYRASLRDESKDKYVDDSRVWDFAEAMLLEIMDELGLEYEKALGEAAFYGPKLDIQMRNVLGKEETVFTIQIDFVLPERFEMEYKNEKGEMARPVVIHRSSIGCLERTMAFLIEFYKGSFPLWLSPEQVRILTIADKYADFASQVEKQLLSVGIRVEADYRSEKIGKKIREARLQRIPYLIVIGEEEEAKNSVMVRNRDTHEQSLLGVDDFISSLKTENVEKSLTLNI